MRETGCYFFVFLPTFGVFCPIFITVSCHSEASLCKKTGGAVFRFRKQAPPLSLSGMRQTAGAGLSRPAVATI